MKLRQNLDFDGLKTTTSLSDFVASSPTTFNTTEDPYAICDEIIAVRIHRTKEL